MNPLLLHMIGRTRHRRNRVAAVPVYQNSTDQTVPYREGVSTFMLYVLEIQRDVSVASALHVGSRARRKYPQKQWITLWEIENSDGDDSQDQIDNRPV
jgi:hypothetical protein